MKKALRLSGIILLTAALFFALHHQLIIIRWPSTQAYNAPLNAGTEKRPVKLYYWHHDKWLHESVDIMWNTHHKGDTIKHLVDSWLSLMDEERRMDKKVSLQSVMLAPQEQEVFISFDRAPFSSESSTYDSWMWVEALLKTMRDNNIKVQSVRFLVHHQDLIDQHLDFSKAWPLMGFLPQQ